MVRDRRITGVHAGCAWAGAFRCATTVVVVIVVAISSTTSTQRRCPSRSPCHLLRIAGRFPHTSPSSWSSPPSRLPPSQRRLATGVQTTEYDDASCWGCWAWDCCSVFTLDTNGRGVRQEVGRAVAMGTAPPPTVLLPVWVTGLWGSVSSVWRPCESQLGELTFRKNSVPFSIICWICRNPAVYINRNWSPKFMLRRPV